MKTFVMVLISGFVIVIGLLFYMYTSQSKKSLLLISPLPQLLSTKLPTVLGSASSWKPAIEKSYGLSKKPDLSAISVLSYDLTTEKLLYSKNIKKRMPIASITKIMTALVAVENEPLTKEITIKTDNLVGENSMGLESGEKLSLEDLLYGLILPSGNDAAEAIAEGSAFGRKNFIFLMNKKAEDLGLTDTHFTNPSGLNGEGDQYSTAFDLLVISRFALQNSTFAKLVSTYEHHIERNSNHKEFYLYNDTNLLTSYPGVKGIKTGFTDEAGMCLLTYLDYGGHKIIAVVLNSENRRAEMKEVLDYSLKSLGVTPPPHS